MWRRFSVSLALRRRFDPIEDFELWYWATLTAGTNMLNASLHRAGLTSDDPVFSTIPGMHWVRQADGSYARELRGPGDISHVGWPPVEGDKPHPYCSPGARIGDDRGVSGSLRARGQSNHTDRRR